LYPPVLATIAAHMPSVVSKQEPGALVLEGRQARAEVCGVSDLGTKTMVDGIPRFLASRFIT